MDYAGQRQGNGSVWEQGDRPREIGLTVNCNLDYVFGAEDVWLLCETGRGSRSRRAPIMDRWVQLIAVRDEQGLHERRDADRR